MDTNTTLTFGILPQDDGDKFRVDPDGRLIARGPFDDNNKAYNITVTVSDGVHVTQQKVRNVCRRCLSSLSPLNVR